jgi:hypothetical protein
MLAALGIVLLASDPHDAAAKAPPLASTIFAAEARADPGYDEPVIVVIPAGAEVELTGAAAPGFLAVYYDGQTLWVPAQHLSIGTRPGIDTAVAIATTPLLDAPMRDAAALGMVPEGGTVILTGANVDDYHAGSYEGTGGWIDGRDLAR